MYCEPNFKTKKALKEAVKAEKDVSAYQPGGLFPSQTDGEATIEGPHGYHRWSARVLLEGGQIVKVIS